MSLTTLGKIICITMQTSGCNFAIFTITQIAKTCADNSVSCTCKKGAQVDVNQLRWKKTNWHLNCPIIFLKKNIKISYIQKYKNSILTIKTNNFMFNVRLKMSKDVNKVMCLKMELYELEGAISASWHH